MKPRARPALAGSSDSATSGLQLEAALFEMDFDNQVILVGSLAVLAPA
jgi:hypothetical protein